MSLYPFTIGEDRPHKGAMYLAALLDSSLYHSDRSFAEAVAEFYHVRLAGFYNDHHTMRPDRIVFTDGHVGWVFFGATTNAAQWLVHLHGSVIPFADTITGDSILTSAWSGALQSLVEVTAELGQAATGVIRFAGHSYGAACAFVMGTWFLYNQLPPFLVEVMTFGEPKVFGGLATLRVPHSHNRIVASLPRSGSFGAGTIDPFSQMPPGALQYAGLGYAWKAAAFIWNLKFVPRGDRYLLSSQEMWKDQESILWGLPITSEALFTAQVAAGTFLHLMDTSYLPKCHDEWIRSGNWPELHEFDNYYRAYVNNQAVIPNRLEPAIAIPVINEAMQLQATPITLANVGDWTNLSATGVLTQPGFFISGEDQEMTQMRGTMKFNSAQGGFSETLNAVRDNETYVTWQTKMVGALRRRARLSYGQDNTLCQNPIIPVAIRVENALVNRDAITTSIVPEDAPLGYPPGPGTRRSSTDQQNANLQLGARIQYRTALDRQSAFILHHGLPIAAFPTFVGGLAADFAKSQLKRAKPGDVWLGFFNDYLGYLWQNQMGFRTLAGLWNLPDGSPDVFSIPDSIFYNATAQMIELQWLPGRLPAPAGTKIQVGQKMRIQMRGWKGFSILNGRWSAVVVAPQTVGGYAVRIIRLMRSPPAGLAMAYASPLAWTIWAPNPNQIIPAPAANVGSAPAPYLDAALTANGPGGIYQFAESKKLGANFDAERGRARNRPT